MEIVPIVAILSLFLVLVRKQIYFLYLWQKKEYRFDKFLDLVLSPKFSAVFLDWFTIFRISSLIALLSLSRFAYSIFNFLIVISILEAGLFILQIIQKRAQLPKVSLKLSLIASLSIAICTAILSTFLDAKYVSDFFQSSVSLNLLLYVAIIGSIILIFVVPIIIGLIILFLTPLDLILKNRIVEKARIHRLNLTNLKVIGISGSFGKSSTKEIIYQLLSSKHNVDKTFKNHNSTLAVARKILSLKPDTEYFISEIGAYRQGDGIDQCKFSQPNCSIITGLNNQHFALFGGKEQIIQAESESLQFLKPGDFAVINWDSKWSHEIKIPKGIKLIKYGFDENADVRAKIIESNIEGTQFELLFEGKKHTMKTNLVTSGNIQNLLAAIAVTLNFGLKIEEISKNIKHLEQPEATLSIQKIENGYIVDDSYNSNLDGILNALTIFESFKGYKVLFLDDIAELGKESASSHQQIAKAIVKVKPDLLILTGKDFSDVIHSYLKKHDYDVSKVVIASPKDSAKIKSIIDSLSTKNNIFLFEGYNSRKYLGLV